MIKFIEHEKQTLKSVMKEHGVQKDPLVIETYITCFY